MSAIVLVLRNTSCSGRSGDSHCQSNFSDSRGSKPARCEVAKAYETHSNKIAKSESKGKNQVNLGSCVWT